jgi:two-component system phosphate regulon sensor histidine kinase PhoR
MHRLGRVYLLIAAVLVATAGLGFYSYSYSSQAASRDRMVILRTMAELAEEKVLGIESEINQANQSVFDAVDISDLKQFQEIMSRERLAVSNVLILDDKLDIVPGGFFSDRVGAQLDAFREFFEKEVLPALPLEEAPLGDQRNHYLSFDGRPSLFTIGRRYDHSKAFYVVVETDLSYLIAVVFPQFFQVRSQHLYQVVDERDELVYGFQFQGIPWEDTVEHPFSETATGWRLRVAHRDRAALRPPRLRKVLDFLLIGLALSVIGGGLVFLLRAVRREQRANELKSEFISNVSHELKTPLSIISMFGELLSMGRTKSPAQATEYAEIIRRESVRLSSLIDNVLDFARLERGVGDVELAEADLGEVVERAAELCGHRADRVELDLEVDIEPDLPKVRIDANAITLATLNLLDNAIKYAADGKRLQVAVRREGERMVLEVRDFGPGIAADEQEAIFERFYRAKAVRLKPVRGSGIGLALVKHIAEAHGGNLEVESTEGEGSTFRLWIPMASPG